MKINISPFAAIWTKYYTIHPNSNIIGDLVYNKKYKKEIIAYSVYIFDS